MAFRFQFGIPPRTAAARSLLGLQRGDPDVVTPGDTTNQGEYGNVTGFGQRDRFRRQETAVSMSSEIRPDLGNVGPDPAITPRLVVRASTAAPACG